MSDQATTVLKLKADRDKAKLELEHKKKSGEEINADLTADFDKKEAEFNLAWKKLQEQISVTAKATEEKISASVAYLKKDKNDKEAVKAGLDAEVDLKAMQGKRQGLHRDADHRGGAAGHRRGRQGGRQARAHRGEERRRRHRQLREGARRDQGGDRGHDQATARPSLPPS